MAEIKIVAWNVENLFHPETGGPRFDMTPTEGWTQERYDGKIMRIAQIIETMLGDAPFVLGLSEVEGLQVVTDLQKHLPAHFALAMQAGWENTYLDCVVLYDSRFFEMEKCTYQKMFSRFARAEYVEVALRLKSSGALLRVMCLHPKARPPERAFTDAYRQAVCDEIQARIWDLHGGVQLRTALNYIKDPEAVKPNELVLDQNVIVMGDFNDEPFATSLTDYLCASRDRYYVMAQKDVKKVTLYNCAWEAMLWEKPGSLYWKRSQQSPWSLLDQIVVSPALLKEGNAIRYKENSFRIVQDLTARPDGRPAHMCDWDDEDNIVWNDDAYSDHFPVRITLTVED